MKEAKKMSAFTSSSRIEHQSGSAVGKRESLNVLT